MYKVSEGVRSTHGQDGAVVLDIQQGQMFNLNLVGARILQLLEARTHESAIVDEISREFGADRDVVSEDVQEFVRVLKERRILKEVK